MNRDLHDAGKPRKSKRKPKRGFRPGAGNFIGYWANISSFPNMFRGSSREQEQDIPKSACDRNHTSPGLLPACRLLPGQTAAAGAMLFGER